MPWLLSIKKLPSSDKKKYIALFKLHDGRYKSVKFGANGYSSYINHKDDARKANYISRHSKEDWTNPMKAGTLSRFILWNKKTLASSIADYKKRFGMVKR